MLLIANGRVISENQSRFGLAEPVTHDRSLHYRLGRLTRSPAGQPKREATWKKAPAEARK
jgi:hypothetical protein